MARRFTDEGMNFRGLMVMALLALGADAVDDGDADVFEDHFGRVAGSHAGLVADLLPDREPWRPALDDEGRELGLLVAAARPGVDEHDVSRGHVFFVDDAVGDIGTADATAQVDGAGIGGERGGLGSGGI